MAKKYLTSTTLIEDVKRRASVPENQQTFTETDFLAFADEELDMGLVPHILTFHEEYFVYTELIPLEASVSRYQIPTRAVGNKLRELSFQDSSGNIFEMARITVEEVPFYQNGIAQHAFNRFYIEGTDVVLLPDVNASATGYLRMSYFLRPNSLVPVDEVGIITAINTTTGEIAVDGIPTDFALSELFDIIQTGSPHKSLGIDLTATSINTTTKTITFDPDDLSSRLQVGDHIALAEQTIVPQVPSDLHSMLSQRVAARCLEALGDAQGLSSANAKIAEMEVKTGALIDNRVNGAPIKINNRHSILKAHRFFGRRF